MFVHILSLMQFLRLDMLMFTCTDCIFSFYYRNGLFWSKTGNDTLILQYNRYILLKVIPQGKPNNKRTRISRLKNSTSSQTLSQSPGTSPKPRCKSTKVFTNIKYSMNCTKTLYILMLLS